MQEEKQNVLCRLFGFLRYKSTFVAFLFLNSLLSTAVTSKAKQSDKPTFILVRKCRSKKNGLSAPEKHEKGSTKTSGDLSQGE